MEAKVERIRNLWYGDVRRWHCHGRILMRNCGDTISSHQYRCAILYLCIVDEPELDVLVNILTHDVGEIFTGDLPCSFKKRAPTVASVTEEYENTFRSIMGFPKERFGVKAEAWRKVVDILDSYLKIHEIDRELFNEYVKDGTIEDGLNTIRERLKVVYDEDQNELRHVVNIIEDVFRDLMGVDIDNEGGKKDYDCQSDQS